MVTIILDSNPLHGRVDPDASSAVKPVLALAAEIGVHVAIPEACLIELREGIREKLREASSRLSEAMQELQRLHINVSDAPAVDESAVLSRYDLRLDAFVSVHKMLVLPFPSEMPDARTLKRWRRRRASASGSRSFRIRTASRCLPPSRSSRDAQWRYRRHHMQPPRALTARAAVAEEAERRSVRQQWIGRTSPGSLPLESSRSSPARVAGTPRHRERTACRRRG